MAIGKIIQMLLRSAGGKKAAAKLYKQARKGRKAMTPQEVDRKWRKEGFRELPKKRMFGEPPSPRIAFPHKSPGTAGVKAGKSYRERPGLTSEGIPDMSMKDYRKFYGKDSRLDKSYMRATRKMEKDDRMAQLWDKRPDVIASRDAAQLADWKKYGSPSRAYFPHKSHGAAGVKTGPMERKWSGRSPAVIRAMKRPQPGMVRGEYPKPSFASRPMETAGRRGETLERIMRMRRDPGMARGLGRMQSRKASALNTPGTPFEGRALRYEPSIARAANFNSLIVKDKGFRTFLKDVVGEKRVMNLPPKMRDRLAKRYLSLKGRGMSGKDARFKEYEIADEASLNIGDFKYGRTPEPISPALKSILENLNK